MLAPHKIAMASELMIAPAIDHLYRKEIRMALKNGHMDNEFWWNVDRGDNRERCSRKKNSLSTLFFDFSQFKPVKIDVLPFRITGEMSDVNPSRQSIEQAGSASILAFKSTRVGGDSKQGLNLILDGLDPFVAGQWMIG